MKNREMEHRYSTVIEACEALHVSRNTLSKLAMDAEAIVRIGSRNIRIDMPKLYAYMESANTVKNGKEGKR